MRSWTVTKTKELLSLNERGLSANEIGMKLNMSRNSIIGKLDRMGIKLNPQKIPRPPRPKVIKMKPLPLTKPESDNPKTMINLLVNECRWPETGEGVDTLFCACNTYGRVYCPYHVGRAYVKHREKPRAVQKV